MQMSRFHPGADDRIHCRRPHNNRSETKSHGFSATLGDMKGHQSPPRQPVGSEPLLVSSSCRLSLSFSSFEPLLIENPVLSGMNATGVDRSRATETARTGDGLARNTKRVVWCPTKDYESNVWSTLDLHGTVRQVLSLAWVGTVLGSLRKSIPACLEATNVVGDGLRHSDSHARTHIHIQKRDGAV